MSSGLRVPETRPGVLTWGLCWPDRCRGRREDRRVSRFYRLVRLVIDLLVLHGRAERSKDVEILALRHQLGSASVQSIGWPLTDKQSAARSQQCRDDVRPTMDVRQSTDRTDRCRCRRRRSDRTESVDRAIQFVVQVVGRRPRNRRRVEQLPRLQRSRGPDTAGHRAERATACRYRCGTRDVPTGATRRRFEGATTG